MPSILTGPSVTVDTTLRSASPHQTTADVGRTAQGEEHDGQVVRGDFICFQHGRDGGQQGQAPNGDRHETAPDQGHQTRVRRPRPVHEIKSDVAAPPAVAAPRARRVSEPSLLNHGLRGRHRRDVSTTAWSHRLISMIVHRSRRGTSWRATTPRASRRYSSKGRRPRRTSSATSAGSSGNSRTWAAPSRRTSCP